MKKKAEGLPQAQKNKIEEQFTSMLNGGIPVEQEVRRKYVGDVAFFYGSVFKKKLAHFRYLQLEELSKIGRTEQLNDIIRANINVLNLIDEWMQTMYNEHQGNLEEIRDSFGDDKSFIKVIKKKYG
jgi:hypothetical protein